MRTRCEQQQLRVGTTVGPLEQLQRAAEDTSRRQQREELSLAEQLNLVITRAGGKRAGAARSEDATRCCQVAALHVALGDAEAARAVYERVLRLEEWGVCEDASGGDQVDNAEETLRLWRCERLHALLNG